MNPTLCHLLSLPKWRRYRLEELPPDEDVCKRIIFNGYGTLGVMYGKGKIKKFCVASHFGIKIIFEAN